MCLYGIIQKALLIKCLNLTDFESEFYIFFYASAHKLTLSFYILPALKRDYPRGICQRASGEFTQSSDGRRDLILLF